jgi:ribonuclease PH
MTTAVTRSYDRAPDGLRPTTIQPGFVKPATGSALITQGETRVICTASVQESVPKWMAGRGRGWATAEYGMLPASTGERKARDVSKGRPDGRTVEIQRLIGRSLRGVIDFEALGERTIYLDCDVLTADGGTRCASITGAFVALDLACRRLVAEGKLVRSPLTGTIEVQATAERTPLSRAHLDELLVLAAGGIEQLRAVQGRAVAG